MLFYEYKVHTKEISMTEMKLTPAQEKLVATMQKEEKKVFDGLNDRDKFGYLAQLEIVTESQSVDHERLNFVADEEEKLAYPILRVANDKNPLGIKKGQVVVGRLLGYVPMFSDKPKENWKEREHKGKTFYESGHILFERENGEKFGIYDYSTLSIVKKIKTRYSNPKIEINPLVSMKFVGRISKAEASEKYDFQMTKGDETNMFEVSVEKGIKFDRYESGIVNYVPNRPPVPSFISKETRGSETIAMDNWNKLEADRGNIQLEGSETSAQITQ